MKPTLMRSAHSFVSSSALAATLICAVLAAKTSASAADAPGSLETSVSQDTTHIARLRSNPVRTYNLSNPERHKLKAKGKLTLLDVKGAGQIVRLHISIGQKISPRDVLLKMYWDGEEHPSVLCPVADFFCDPFGPANSLQFATPYFGNASRHWYCYLPMPFANGARIEVENQGAVDDNIVAYDVSVEEWKSDRT